MSFCGEADVKCPYYRRESAYTITCEGIEYETEHITKFKSEKDKLMFIETRCAKLDAPCVCAALLNERYITDD